jgi:lysophospholipase L1-like esterase
MTRDGAAAWLGQVATWVGVGLCLSFPGLLAAEEPRVRVVTLGDSITRGVRAGVKAEETFSALHQDGLGKRKVAAEVVNVGIGGERTDQALQRLARTVLALKPQVVVVMYGTNDSYVDRGQKECRLSAEQYGANLRKLVAGIRKAGARPVLMTPPCWGKRAAPNGAGEHPNVRLEKYVRVCREVARETKVPLVDHYARWSKRLTEGGDPGEWTTDQCHPNPRGHREIADALLPVIVEVLGKEKTER